MSMAGYTKLFNSILASTIWRESKETKILWITMLAMADKNGIVEASEPGLADIARLSLPETLQALKELSSPDAYSRTKEHEGRRIEALEGGAWRILNHAKYRAKMNADDRREYLRVKQAEHRERKRKQDVNTGNAASTPSTHAEAKADTEAKERRTHTRTESVEAAATRLFREKNPKFEGKILEEIECPICYRAGNLKLTQARGSHPAGFWCDKRGGCGANWPLNTEAILSLMTPRGRKAIEAMLPASERPYESPGMIISSELKFDDKGMLIE